LDILQSLVRLPTKKKNPHTKTFHKRKNKSGGTTTNNKKKGPTRKKIKVVSIKKRVPTRKRVLARDIIKVVPTKRLTKKKYSQEKAQESR